MIVPETSALISFITFIASIMQTTVSGVTFWPTVTKAGDSGEAAVYKVPTIGEMISLPTMTGFASGAGAAGVAAAAT